MTYDQWKLASPPGWEAPDDYNEEEETQEQYEERKREEREGQ